MTATKLWTLKFNKDILENLDLLEKAVKALEMQGLTYSDSYWLHDKLSECGFPDGAVRFQADGRRFWAKTPGIEASLRTLASLNTIKPLLKTKEDVKIYLHTLKLLINLIRCGDVPSNARTEKVKLEHSLETRNEKKEVMRAIIENIFRKRPHSPKTVGAVWYRISDGYEGVRNSKTKKEYIARTGKDAQGKEIVIILGDGIKSPFTYAKRSLQHFIDELK